MMNGQLSSSSNTNGISSTFDQKRLIKGTMGLTSEGKGTMTDSSTEYNLDGTAIEKVDRQTLLLSQKY